MKINIEEMNTKIVRAINNGNEAQLEKFVRQVHQAGLIDAFFVIPGLVKATLLMYYVKTNNHKMVKQLLTTYNANRLIKDDENYNALFMATEQLLLRTECKEDILNLLLEKDAEAQIEIQETREGYSVLTICIFYSNAKLLSKFLNITHNPLFYSSHAGYYLMHLACENLLSTLEQKREVVEVLLQYQPEKQLMLPGKLQELPVHLLLSRGVIGLLPLLLRHIPKEQLLATTGAGDSVLHIAAKNLQFGVIAALKKHELMPRLVNLTCGDHGVTALHMAITNVNDNEELKDERLVQGFVAELLKWEADVMSGPIGLIPLECCCQSNYQQVAELLLTKNFEAQMQNRNVEGYTPLFTAIYYGSVNLVKYFLQLPICQTRDYLLTPSKSGLLPIHMAIYRCGQDKTLTSEYIEILQELLKFFPDEQLSTKWLDSTPLMMAKEMEIIEMIDYLSVDSAANQLLM